MPPHLHAHLTALLVLCLGACQRTITVDLDEEVDRICEAYCVMNLDCEDPPIFERAEDCTDSCKAESALYYDDECGDAYRDAYTCVGSTMTCAQYHDTNNVSSESYTCQTEKTRVAHLACGGANE